MKISKSLFKGLSLAVAVVALSACGSKSQSAANQGSNLTDTGSTGGGSTTTTTQSGNPAQPYQFTIHGNPGSQTINNIVTETLLKVKITPSTATPFNGGQVAPYGCVNFQVALINLSTNQVVASLPSGNISVGSLAQPTNGPCINSQTNQQEPTSKIVDFSGYMTGSGTYGIRIEDANYDNCRFNAPVFYNGQWRDGWQFYGCSMSSVYSTHLVNGSATIQVNGTYFP